MNHAHWPKANWQPHVGDWKLDLRTSKALQDLPQIHLRAFDWSHCAFVQIDAELCCIVKSLYDAHNQIHVVFNWIDEHHRIVDIER
jgi:hypothetical protein